MGEIGRVRREVTVRTARALLAVAVMGTVIPGPLGGCAVSQYARGTPGANISAVRPGATRASIEARLGAPVREWHTRAGIRYRLYRYDAGVRPSAGDAAGFLFLDVISLGLAEAFKAMEPESFEPRPHERQRNLAVGFDADDVAIGVFVDVSEFDRLPDDGRSPEPGGAATKPAP